MRQRPFFVASVISVATIGMAIVALLFIALITLCGCASRKAAHDVTASEAVTVMRDSSYRSEVSVVADSSRMTKSFFIEFDSVHIVSFVPSVNDGVLNGVPSRRDGGAASSVIDIKGARVAMASDSVGVMKAWQNRSESEVSDSTANSSMKSDVSAPKKEKDSAAWAFVFIALIIAAFGVIYWYDRIKN